MQYLYPMFIVYLEPCSDSNTNPTRIFNFNMCEFEWISAYKEEDP